MNIIFLDFDGVLNSTRSAVATINLKRRQKFDDHQWAILDPIAIGLVNKLCEEALAYVIVSSTWRLFTPMEEFNKRFTKMGFIYINCIDRTPDSQDGHRGRQIDSWMKQQTFLISNYVILDDDSDMLESQKDHFIHVPHANGLLLEHYRKALGILNPTHPSLVQFDSTT